MKNNPDFKLFDLMKTLNSLTERYVNSDIQDAHSALVEAEQLLRDIGGVPSCRFALGMAMAKRNDIVLHLGDAASASSIMEEALQIFQQEPSAMRFGLLTREAVLKFIREQDTMSNVRWRSSVPAH